jgi:rubrerythrin
MTTHGIDFDKLELREALDLAVLIEEEAQERYVEFADQMDLHHSADAAEFFRFMARNEEKHGRQLSGQRAALFGTEPRVVTRAMLFDVEAPEYDRARAFMTPRQAMEAALAAEEKAQDFFVAALHRVRDQQVRALFETLRDEEVQHQDLVWHELEKLPPDSSFDTSGFADDPVALG